MSADRARDFLSRIEASNVGAETLDQLADDVRRLVIANQQQPLASYLGDLVATQDRAFTLLEGRQRPEQSWDLYLVAGITCGLAEALRPVLDLPPSQRIHKIVTAVERVRTALSAIKDPGRDAVELAGAIEGWTAERLTQPR